MSVPEPMLPWLFVFRIGPVSAVVKEPVASVDLSAERYGFPLKAAAVTVVPAAPWTFRAGNVTETTKSIIQPALVKFFELGALRQLDPDREPNLK